MKKLSVLFLLPLLAFNFINDWQPVTLADRITILFPLKPMESEMSGNKVWIADPDENSRCMAMVIDFGLMGMDTLQMEEEFGRPEAFEEFRDGVVRQLDNALLLKESNTTENGHRTFAFDLKKPGDSLSMNYMYIRNYFIGTKLIALNYFEMKRTEKNEVREKFFNSLKAK